METVNIVSNSFDAEQGMAGGSAINVAIKSGTNQYHGSLHWFHTNAALRARNFFNTTTGIPKNILNQGGYTIGGPIKKNKLFFFAAFQETSTRQSPTGLRAFVPTAAMLQGDFTTIAFDRGDDNQGRGTNDRSGDADRVHDGVGGELTAPAR